MFLFLFVFRNLKGDSSMTSKERVWAVLQGKESDRIPVCPKIAFATAQYANRTVGDYLSSPETIAECVIGAARKFGWDSIAPHTDISLDGMALGSEYQLCRDEPYRLKKHLMRSIDELEKVVIRDPWDCPGYSTVLRATELTIKEAGDEFFIQAWCNGPMNISSQLLDFQELLVSTIEDPEAVHALFELCTEATIRHARELVRLGVDAVAFGHATVSPNVASRKMYCEFGLPYEKRIVDAIHEKGGIAITHICGKIETIIDKIAENGSDVIDFDASNDIRYLIEKTNCQRVFRGNIDPVLFSHGTAEQVTAAVKALLARNNNSGKLLLGSGCEINLNTPEENLYAFVNAAHGGD